MILSQVVLLVFILCAHVRVALCFACANGKIGTACACVAANQTATPSATCGAPLQVEFFNRKQQKNDSVVLQGFISLLRDGDELLSVCNFEKDVSATLALLDAGQWVCSDDVGLLSEDGYTLSRFGGNCCLNQTTPSANDLAPLVLAGVLLVAMGGAIKDHQLTNQS